MADTLRSAARITPPPLPPRVPDHVRYPTWQIPAPTPAPAATTPQAPAPETTPPTDDGPPADLSARDAANLLGCSATFIYKMAAEGLIEHQRIGNRIRFREDWLKNYLRANHRKPTTPAPTDPSP